MEERLKFIARLLDGEKMAEVSHVSQRNSANRASISRLGRYAARLVAPAKCFSTMYFEWTTIGSTSSKSVAPPT